MTMNLLVENRFLFDPLLLLIWAPSCQSLPKSILFDLGSSLGLGWDLGKPKILGILQDLVQMPPLQESFPSSLIKTSVLPLRVVLKKCSCSNLTNLHLLFFVFLILFPTCPNPKHILFLA